MFFGAGWPADRRPARTRRRDEHDGCAARGQPGAPVDDGRRAGWTAVTISAVIGYAAIGLGFYGSPQVFVRFISLRSEKEIKKGAGVALTWTLLADSGAVLVGNGGPRAVRHRRDRRRQGQHSSLYVADAAALVLRGDLHRDGALGDHVDDRLAAGRGVERRRA